jgi:hypothetical protein
MAGYQYPKLLTNSTSVFCLLGFAAPVEQRLRTNLDGFDVDHQVSLFDFESNWDTLDSGAYVGFTVCT